MARKRIIDPAFWTDSVMVQLPFEARLLFIGLWNFADDYGYLDDEPERIALQILPADDVDVEMLLELLIVAERVDRYVGPSGKRFLHIRHFSEHQRVDHPSRPTFPELGVSKKLVIPLATRREVAMKYGCPPGERRAAECYYCGAPGQVVWWPGRKGARPTCWIVTEGLEFDHFLAEADGGPTTTDNLVLACRACNRGKHSQNGVDFALGKPREPSRKLPKRREGSRQVN